MNTRRCFVLLLTVALAAATAGVAEDHPAHWWQPMSESEQQWWEIVPHEAGPGELVLSKRNELGIFSNFAQTPFYFQGKRYESVEGFWYMLAYPEGPDDPRLENPNVEWPHTREEVSQMVGFEAKTAGAVAEGNMAILGINWVTFEGRRLKYWSHERGEHYELIRQVLHEKVRQNPRVQELLLSTGNLTLMPDNYDSLRDLPAWRYFDIHQEIRDGIRSGTEAPPSCRYPEPWAAGRGEVTLSNRNELGILLHSAPTPFEFRGKRYESVEALAQNLLVAGKTPDRDFMVSALRAKLEQNPEVARILLATGDLILHPDRPHAADALPASRYDEIWMTLRSELEAQHPRTLKVVRTDGSLVDF